MECVHRALNGGFGQETGAKTAAFAGDDLFVDELLDFSNGFCETEEVPSEEEKTEEKAKSCFNSPNKQTIEPENGFVSLPETELNVPAEEGLESLEWLSHFVEDSFSDYSLAGKLPPKPEVNGSATPAAQPCFTTPVHTKARTKRARTGSRVWPVISPSSSSSSSSSSSPTTSLNQAEYFFLEKKAADNGSSVARRCSHCGVTKTPQWRAGPLGAKTLCNACGVRFKSGRLVPEYRPACSPTFSSELHSNNHRKVLEMRRKKEAPGVPSPVQSFCKSN